MAIMQDKTYKKTEAERRAALKYLQKLETISVRMPKGEKSKFKDAAEKAGMSLNKFAITSMLEKIEREGL